MALVWWERAAVAGAVIAVALVLARLADRAITRRAALDAETLTRYRVLRRSIVATIVAVGVVSALLVIPEVRAVAGGVLASSAVLGLVVGFAARSTLANFVGGLMIAFTQPLRIGDRIEVAGAAGTVEEIGLTYTTIRVPSGGRVYVPNERLASDTIRNDTIAGSEHLAEATVPVPHAADLDWVLAMLADEARAAHESSKEAEVMVSQVDAGGASVTVRAWAPDAAAAERLRARVLLGAHRRLRERGIWAE